MPIIHVLYVYQERELCFLYLERDAPDIYAG